MSVNRLSWAEILAWVRTRRLIGEAPLNPFEINMVRRLSEEYAGQYNISSAKDCPSPYAEEQFDRKAVANKISNIFSRLVKNPKEKRYEEVE